MSFVNFYKYRIFGHIKNCKILADITSYHPDRYRYWKLNMWQS